MVLIATLNRAFGMGRGEKFLHGILVSQQTIHFSYHEQLLYTYTAVRRSKE